METTTTAAPTGGEHQLVGNNNPFAIGNNTNTSSATSAASDIISRSLKLLESNDLVHLAHDDDDDDDDNFGPESDVDPPHHFQQPTTEDSAHKITKPSQPTEEEGAEPRHLGDDEGHFNPFMEHQEKAALEMERSLQQKRKEEELVEEEEEESKDDGRGCEEDAEVEIVMGAGKISEVLNGGGQKLIREETPTPPADAVHDVGGLEDTESEDEWKYIQGDLANNKENIPPQPKDEVADISAEDSNMSQLNPNAAEFVPVVSSPTRTTPTSPPASSKLPMTLNDDIVTQSPSRTNQQVDLEIQVPKEDEFSQEAKSRPSELESPLNNHDENDFNKSSADQMDELLNGKNIDDIPEFQPGSTPKKTPFSDEFHFGPNASPFTTSSNNQSSVTMSSTKALFGDDTQPTLGSTPFETSLADGSLLNTDLLNKESDPMSMSFYADKDNTNPFDLNEVQLLPDDVDKFIKDNDDAIQTTDLDKRSNYDDEKELASPLEDAKTPEPTHENLLGGEEFRCDTQELNAIAAHDEQSDQVGSNQAVEVADLLGAGVEHLPKDVELLAFKEGSAQENLQALTEQSSIIPTPELVESKSPDVVTSPQLFGSESASPLLEQVNAEPISPAPEIAMPPLPTLIPPQETLLLQPEIGAITPDFTQDTLVNKAQDHFQELCDVSSSENVINQPSEVIPIENSQIFTNGEHIDVTTGSAAAPEFAVTTTILTPLEETPTRSVVEEVPQVEVGAIALAPLEEPSVKLDQVQLKEVKEKASTPKVEVRKSTTPTRKSAPAQRPSTVSKVEVAKASPKANSPRTITSRVSLDRPSSATSSRSKPPTPSANRLLDNTKKPITNGDVHSNRSLPIGKKEVASKVGSKPATLTSKTAAAAAPKPTTRTVTTSKAPFTARPAPTTTTLKHTTSRTTTATSTTTTTTAAKRPTTLGTARAVTSTVTRGAVTSTVTSTAATRTTSSAKTTTVPRAAPAPKPKVPSASLASAATAARTKASPLAAQQADKQSKETANKLTASRTARIPPTASARSVVPPRKGPDTKGASSAHTTVSKTTTTVMKSTTGKKPVEIVKKTKTTKIEKPKENGVPATVTQEIHVVNNATTIEPQLIKDNSPIDNKLIITTNNNAD